MKVNRSLRVTGYTCSLGPQGYNRRLSLTRAQRVARYLQEQLAIEPERPNQRSPHSTQRMTT